MHDETLIKLLRIYFIKWLKDNGIYTYYRLAYKKSNWKVYFYDHPYVQASSPFFSDLDKFGDDELINHVIRKAIKTSELIRYGNLISNTLCYEIADSVCSAKQKTWGYWNTKWQLFCNRKIIPIFFKPKTNKK